MTFLPNAQPAVRRFLLMSVGFALSTPASCVPWQSTRPLTSEQVATQTAFGAVSTGRISVHEEAGKPRVTTVIREGDPASAIAALVLTGGDSVQSVALSAVVQERLRTAGVKHVEVAADRFSYRVRALVTTPAQAHTFVMALRAALEQPIRSASPELAETAMAVQELHRRPLDGVDLAPVASCTGELGAPPSTPKLDPTTPAGADQLERWRKEFHGTSRIALAVVGPAPFGQAVKELLRAGKPWPEVRPPDDPWPERDHTGAYLLPGSSSGSPRLTVAARVGPTFAVSALAERTFHAEGPLAARLAASTSWRLTRTVATVRPRGACLAITVEREAARKDLDLAQDAARITAHIAHEIQMEVDAAKADASVAGERVLRAADPRDAASLAVWWSHAARLQPGATRLAVALGIPPNDVSPKAGATELDQQVNAARTALQSALPKSTSAWLRPTIDAASRVESGQGKLWLLLASPCGTSAETEVDAGFTALAALSAARAASGMSDVKLEPWVAQDGVGLLAHAAPKENETPAMLARRVGEAAAAALLGPPPPNHVVASTRGRLLTLFESASGPHSEAHGLLARALSPRHPAWLAPFGLRKSVMEADARSIELRRAALSNGPLRVAVLANDDAKQAEIAVQTVDRWVVHRGSSPRSCPPIAASGQPLEEAKDVTVDGGNRLPQALLGLAIRNPTPSDVAMMELLREALGGKGGWMTEAFRSFEGPVKVDVRTLGQRRMLALVVELHCADELLDRAVQQARAVLARMRQGAATQELLQHSSTALESRRLTQQLDPRVRLAQTWRRESAPSSAPSLGAWNPWLGRVLQDESLAIVRVRPVTESK